MNKPAERSLRFTLPTKGASIAEARRRIADHLEGMGCAEGRIVDAVLAANEAVTNAVGHAYGDGNDGEVRVGVSGDGPNFFVSISDDGDGPGPNLTRPHGRCLGFPIMAELAERLVVTGDKDTGTTITLTFARAAQVRL